MARVAYSLPVAYVTEPVCTCSVRWPSTPRSPPVVHAATPQPPRCAQASSVSSACPLCGRASAPACEQHRARLPEVHSDRELASAKSECLVLEHSAT
eukprot:g10557.t1